MSGSWDSVHIAGTMQRGKLRNGKSYRIFRTNLSLAFENIDEDTYYADNGLLTAEDEFESGTSKDSEGGSEQSRSMEGLLDTSCSSTHWDASFATPSGRISEDSGCSSPPFKQQKITSPPSSVPLMPSPLSFCRSVQPLCLEKELTEASSTSSLPPPMTPPPFTSPPHIEHLRLFDTPQTPKSIIRRSSSMETDKQEITCSVKNGSTRRQRSSRLAKSTPQLRRKPSRGTNINPFASVERTRRTRGRNGRVSSSAPATVLKEHHKLALKESNIYRFRHEFLELGVVGAGSFGIVYKCINRLDGCVYALKRSHQPVAGSANESAALREVYAHAVLGSHPHLVRYYSAWAEDNHMIIQNEFCNGGNLSSAISDYRRMGINFTEQDLKRLMSHLAKGLQYIHSMGLVHLDIKPENVFLCLPECDGLENEVPLSPDSMEIPRPDLSQLENNPTYKIGDMGHITSINDPQVEEGDCRFLSRELLQEDYQDLREADVFSLGLTVFCAGSLSDLPKNGDDWHRIRDGFLPALPQCSEQFNSFLVSLINPIPALRPTTSDIIVHPLVCPNSEKSQAQLRKELNEERLKNEKLSRELQQLKRANEDFSSPVPAKKRLVGGLRTYRSNSVINF